MDGKEVKKRGFMHRMYALVLFTIGVGISMLMIGQQSYGEDLKALQATLPDRIMDWTREGEDRFFDDQTIFDYIDGAGEVYRAYRMKQCLSRRYNRSEGPAIMLDIFDMGSSEDAFGVFTHDPEGEPLEMGQDALYRSGWLSLWKDRFFVSVYADKEIPGVEKVLKALGSSVASLIKNQGPRPQILSLLPREGLQNKSIRYFHSHLVLNTHYFLSTENILNLRSNTHAALASYKRGNEYATIMVITYPDKEKVLAAGGSFLKHYLPDADERGMAKLENGKWAAVRHEGERLLIVLEADSRELARELIERLMAKAP